MGVTGLAGMQRFEEFSVFALYNLRLAVSFSARLKVARVSSSYFLQIVVPGCALVSCSRVLITIVLLTLDRPLSLQVNGPVQFLETTQSWVEQFLV